ncbi:MAG: putative amidohydrolase [Planctomycetota bacterium]|jgi:predicted amidohydrolase
MKICGAQTKPVKGDISANIENHKKLIDRAVANRTDIVISPELSLTGYEPELARELAINQDDTRLDGLQEISDAKKIAIGVGTPTQSDTSPRISTILFQPYQTRQTHSKRHLHSDEEKFFIRGANDYSIVDEKNNIALAICYELSVPEHAENAYRNGATTYIASVAKDASGVKNASERLAGIAHQYSMTVLMSNCMGQSSDFECVGNTSIWNNKGSLVGQLNDTKEGILIIDTKTQEIIEEFLVRE